MKIAVMIEGTPDAIKKACYDCYHNQAAMSWWCRNEEAVEYRRTAIPNIYGCPFWKPVRTIDDLSPEEKKVGNFITINSL